MSTIERAIAIAAEAHAGQLDKAGAPYVLHPLRVMLRMETNDGRIAAVLHDVVEDSHWSLEALRAEGFSERILRAVDSVTRRKDETYEDFVSRAGVDPLGRLVKLADLEDNLAPGRIAEPTEEDLARMRRYRRAIGRLLGQVSPPGP